MSKYDSPVDDLYAISRVYSVDGPLAVLDRLYASLSVSGHVLYLKGDRIGGDSMLREADIVADAMRQIRANRRR